MARPYPSMYFRMALHIGMALAAFVLLGAVSLASIAAWQLQSYVATRQSSLGTEAADVLTRGGRSALENWLQNEAAARADVEIYVLDQNSNDILGRTIPRQYQNFIRDSVIARPEDDSTNFHPVRLAPQLIGPDGKSYAFLVLPEGISIWGSTATALGVLAAALLVIASVAWLIARAFSRPIGELQLAVRELASGDISARVPESISERRDELGTLAADFNTMAEQLSSLLENRQSLMRDMSHELRSPLARMQAALALAEHRNQQTETKNDAEYFARIEQDIRHMNKVIGEMLRYSTVDTAIPPQARLVRIDKLLTELIEREEIEATNKGCHLTLKAEKNLPVVGDPELLRSGMENMLRNAIRFAPSDTEVLITAQRESNAAGDRIAVTVKDRGPGVAPEHLEEIFEPYFRIAGKENDQQGTGLGLAIVKRVFASHAGKVVAMPRDGGGLTLAAWLPVADLD